MIDKRNIVIKVKYPVSGKAPENPTPKMVTEWNVKRILLAAGVLVLILSSLFYVINNDTQETNLDNTAAIVSAAEKQVTPEDDNREADIKSRDIPSQSGAKANPSVKPEKELIKKSKQTTGIAAKEVIKKQSSNKFNKEQWNSDDNHNVSRAWLTYKIDNKAPGAEVVKVLDVSREKPVWVDYFIELRAMNGKRVYHEWLKNGVVVSRKASVISGDSSRTSSRKLLSDSEQGNWAVRLVDEKGRLLNEKKFKVE